MIHSLPNTSSPNTPKTYGDSSTTNPSNNNNQKNDLILPSKEISNKIPTLENPESNDLNKRDVTVKNEKEEPKLREFKKKLSGTPSLSRTKLQPQKPEFPIVQKTISSKDLAAAESFSEFDIIEPSEEFYSSLIALQYSDLLKTSKDPKKLYQAIENLFHASLFAKNGHLIQKLAEFISQIQDVECAKGVIDKIFENIEGNFKKTDPQCGRKFGDALSAALMKIIKGNQKKEDQFDLVRLEERNAAEAALKKTLVSVIVLDGAAQSVYQPILYSGFNAVLAALWFDHFRLVYLDKTLATKDLDLNKQNEETKYKLTSEGLEKVREIGYAYHAAIGERPPQAYQKVWPSGMKLPFTGFFKALERAEKNKPNTTNVNNNNNASEKNIVIRSIKGKEFKTPTWKIGSLALFGSMCIFRPIFNVWLEKLKLKESFIFSNPESLRASLKELLFDPHFYSSSLLQQKELNEKIFSIEAQNIKFRKEYGRRWKINFTEKLNKLSHKTQNDTEKELIDRIIKKVEGYKDEQLPSRQFGADFSAIIDQFKNHIFASRIRTFINDATAIGLINALPFFKLSDNKRDQTEEITSLYSAIMGNNLSQLSKLTDKAFAAKMSDFLRNWGEKLQVILPKNVTISTLLTLINFNKTVVNKKISALLQEKFKLPVSIDELPIMLQGMQELQDKNLVELFRGFCDNSDLKEALKEEVIHELLYDAKSTVIDELEAIVQDEDLLSIQFDVLLDLCPDEKKILDSRKTSWIKFTKAIKHLVQCENFKESFKKQYKDNASFREHLIAITHHPDIYKKYDLLTIYVFFKLNKNKFNSTDEIMVREKARTHIGMNYDIPTQTAAKKIHGGDDYTIEPLDEKNYDGYLRQLKRPMEIFGVEGKIKDYMGQDVLYHKILGEVDASFVEFDKIENEDFSTILNMPSEKLIKAGQEFVENEVETLMNFINTFFQDKNKQEQRDLWHFVLRLAIESSSEKNIKYCLNKLESLDPFTQEDIKKHLKFIVENIKDNQIKNSWEIIKDYFFKKSECKQLADQLRLDPATLMSNLTTEHKKEVEKKEKELIYKAILGPTLSTLKSCVKKLDPGTVPDFLTWILNPNNLFFKDYLQVTSITNTAKLEIAQFSQLLNNDLLLKVLPELGRLNAYFFTEVFSDHLGMGLADPSKENTKEYQSQQAALSKLSEIMIDMLNNRPSKQLLVQDWENFSIYHQSLSPDEMRKFANAYQDQYTGNNISNIQYDIEYSFFPMMQMNIESCRILLESLANSKLYGLLQKGLIARYSAVDKLLHHYKELSLDESLELGRQTILVAPTLAYCIAALDKVNPNPKLQEVINNNSLEKALNTAALLVRLTNDIGTIPLLNPEESLKKFKKHVEAKNLSGENFLTILKGLQEDEWSRMVKDGTFGENNVCIDSLCKITDASKALEKFESNILVLSKIYQQKRKELVETIEVIDNILGDQVPGKLILNFVAFHEKLYSMNAMTKQGEYAIAGSNPKKVISS